MADEKLTQMDLYELFGIDIGATDKQIVKAFRLKALKVHPDKNPDNPRAVELFQQLSKAFELLSDKSARAAYDKLYRAREAARARRKELDSKRRTLKEELELRERNAQLAEKNYKTVKEDLIARMKRLQEEGSEILRREQELLTEQIQGKSGQKRSRSSTSGKLKVSWKKEGYYDETALSQIYSSFGDISLIVINKKRTSALIEMMNVKSNAIDILLIKGDELSPLRASWLEQPPISRQMGEHNQSFCEQDVLFRLRKLQKMQETSDSAEPIIIDPDDVTDLTQSSDEDVVVVNDEKSKEPELVDQELSVLEKLRRAQKKNEQCS